MITLSLHDETHIALRNCYAERDAIKALAGPPDVRFDGESRQWLMHVALMDQLFNHLGAVIAPSPVDFWCDCPLYEAPAAKPVRRSKQQIMAEKRQQQAAAGRFGRAIVEMGKR